jgi:hypothetical protein
MTCTIRWIDQNGKPTPDDNPAIGEVQCEAYTLQNEHALNGVIRFSETQWFPICATHAARLSERGMEHWVFRATGGTA